MLTGNSVVNLYASESILPYSCVCISGAYTVKGTNSPSEYIVGVVDGSVSDPEGIYHAVAGQPVSFQTGLVVEIRAALTTTPITNDFSIVRGKCLSATATNGGVSQFKALVVPVTSSPVQFVAMESVSPQNSPTDPDDKPLVTAFRVASYNQMLFEVTPFAVGGGGELEE